ncbi:hypothetical protein ACERK3_15455 [Phycisphaerales bacterium AB-hyl4]|uniref:Zinc ribbon domain-containing protein n=1 Tax=Natronomicrosphaera hydrolytica TaxID=3242702 RepID=A0ABV4UA35_9BACT
MGFLHDDDPLMSKDGYFDDEGPGEHDAHLFDRDDGENDTTPCPKCGTELLAFADRCYHCGELFPTEAWQAHSETRWSRVGIAVCILIMLAFLFLVVLP